MKKILLAFLLICSTQLFGDDCEVKYINGYAISFQKNNTEINIMFDKLISLFSIDDEYYFRYFTSSTGSQFCEISNLDYNKIKSEMFK